MPRIEANGVADRARSRSTARPAAARSRPVCGSRPALAPAKCARWLPLPDRPGRRRVGVRQASTAVRWCRARSRCTPTVPLPVRNGRNCQVSARQCIGAVSGRMIVFPTPARRRHVGLVEPVFRRIGGSEGQARSICVGQTAEPCRLDHRRDLDMPLPREIVQGADARELAAEAYNSAVILARVRAETIWRRVAAVRLLTMAATSAKKKSVATFSGSAIVKV